MPDNLLTTHITLQAGTVCARGFSDAAAAVICSEMGYENLSSMMSGSYYWDIQKSYPIILDEVRCSEEGASFSDCSFQAPRDCFHWEDVFLVCGRQGNIERYL